MTTATHPATGLVYDVEGAGAPVVFLHGLTFDRRSWRPIIDRLGRSVRSIAIDLPAHGENGGGPAPLDHVAAQVHELLASLAVEQPIPVGHSMSAGLALVYASAYPTRGLVVVDNGPDVRPFAELVQRLEPVLRGPGFANAWQTFEHSLGLERIPEPVRSLVLATHRVKQEVVVGYWEMLLRADPAELQAWIDAEIIPKLDVPCLAVFGRPVTDRERERFGWLPDVQLEEWVSDGHFVHLVDPDRFASRLRRFVDHCLVTS
jgi:pimeloyl-ACP methyl ester carboxylesterase